MQGIFHIADKETFLNIYNIITKIIYAFYLKIIM